MTGEPENECRYFCGGRLSPKLVCEWRASVRPALYRL